MNTVVKLIGQKDALTFRVAEEPKGVAERLYNHLCSGFTQKRGPLDLFASFCKYTSVNPYPDATQIPKGEPVIIVKQNAQKTDWEVSTEEVERVSSNSYSLNTKKLNTFSDCRQFLDSFNKPKLVFEVGGHYVVRYNSGTNPGADRFIRIKEVYGDHIIVDDLAVAAGNNPVRNFSFKYIENVRKVS